MAQPSQPVTAPPQKVGHYRIIRKLGQGGMGVVYAAHDERLDRPVAIKMVRDAAPDDEGREQMWREARAAAGVNHPNICQIYEIGDHEGNVFIAMELLEGESLADRIARAPLLVAEAIQIGLGVLSAVTVLHARNMVHRDLKPSNIFLTAHGVKLLDFGLAHAAAVATVQGETLSVTGGSAVTGTPEYMAPEQLEGKPTDVRTDIFAIGIILFEMLTGKRPFLGESAVELFHAIVYEQPPALGGSPAVSAVDRVVRKSLEKQARDRYPTAHAMAQELRSALLLEDSGVPTRARSMTRLIVLPFRILRKDEETDFLAFSLPDAITCSLSGLQSLVVRSTLVASRFAGDSVDLKALAAETEVDVVVTGTLVRMGPQVRISTQLVEAPNGTLVWSQNSQVKLDDVFQFQDELVHRIVESLSLPLTAREHRMLKHDVPASPGAYELYLRANQLSVQWSELALARDLYLQCVDQDPYYAPAWARLGNCYRRMAKYVGDMTDNFASAAAAFNRALEINPELPMAHTYFAYLEADQGKALDGMVRLLQRAQSNTNDPELLAGLVHVCRYCGLLDASAAAHQLARRLDPQMPTSVVQSYFMMGNYQTCLESGLGVDAYLDVLALIMMERTVEALALIRRRVEKRGAPPLIIAYLESLRFLVGGDAAGALAALTEFRKVITTSFRDPEAQFYLARSLAFLGEGAGAIDLLNSAIDQSYYCYSAMARDPWFDSIRTNPGFVATLRKAETQVRQSLAAFREAGGERTLDVSPRL